LVSDGNITINGAINLTINQPASTSPSGLLAKNNININAAANITMTGLLYSNNTLSFANSACNLNVTGGIIALLADFKGTSNTTVNYNPSKVSTVLGGAQFSPVVTVQHWEEEY